jgi:hypothetical protein
MSWGKRYSGPHCAWFLTRSGIDVQWETDLPRPVQDAISAVSREYPGGNYAPILLSNEEEAAKVVEYLNAHEVSR